MHRLVIRAVQEFLRDTYGEALLREVAACERTAAGSGEWGRADDANATKRRLRGESVISAAADILDKPAIELFEDLGAWLAQREPIRRLLRFSGRDFKDFVLSLEELPGRVHYVIPDMEIPAIQVLREDDGTIVLTLPDSSPAWTAILGGLLRAMADDYGALGLIVVEGCGIEVHISDHSFTEGRDFHLGAGYLAGAAKVR